MRAAALALAFGVALSACGTRDSASPGAAETLPSFAPASGGTMILVPAGEFVMGDAKGRPDEAPHSVAVGAFSIDVHPITQEVYRKVMGANPSKGKNPLAPVCGVQWLDAARFCNLCSEADGLRPCYDPATWACDFSADGYRLPTEAEWEYACRAGSAKRYVFGDGPSAIGSYAWTKGNSGGKLHPAGQKGANAWGLRDMLGHVWEWCNDWYAEDYYLQSPREDPRGPAEGKQRVLRGGALDVDPEGCRPALRKKEFPVYTDACFGVDSNGFRRVKSPVRPAARPEAVAASTPEPAPATARPVAAIPAPAAVPATAPPPVASAHATTSASLPAAAARKEIPGLRGTIAFVSDRTGALEIWRMGAEGSGIRQLTKDGTPHADPKFSPDGKAILHTAVRGGLPEVWLMDRDGSHLQKVAGGSQGNWSPDGKSIVFIRDNRAWIRDLATGSERRVTPEGWERFGVPAWSPDGKTIAVASRHEGTIGIYLIPLGGREPVRLPTEEPSCTPAWSRDGRRLLCQTVKGHVCEVGANGEDWEQVTFGADVQHDACYSPDGTAVVYCRAPGPSGPWQVCLQKLDADAFVQITNEGSNSLPNWHPLED